MADSQISLGVTRALLPTSSLVCRLPPWFDEIVSLPYSCAYSMFARALRRHHVRPHCESRLRTRCEHAITEHPPGEKSS